MSPRSEEFMAQARERLGAAEMLLGAGFASAAVSSAYYAMLYAARAALSEQDEHAKTHRGTWDRFHHVLVEPGRFDADLAAQARRVQRPREAADYDARPVEPEQAREICAVAERFVATLDTMLG
jgi:uncharacterized protein (UPF0332 family)